MGIRADKKNAWKAITNFIEHNIGFDYTIEAHYDEFPNDIIELEWSKTTTQGWDIVEKKRTEHENN